jgi:hypothetical protein
VTCGLLVYRRKGGIQTCGLPATRYIAVDDRAIFAYCQRHPKRIALLMEIAP